MQRGLVLQITLERRIDAAGEERGDDLVVPAHASPTERGVAAAVLGVLERAGVEEGFDVGHFCLGACEH